MSTELQESLLNAISLLTEEEMSHIKTDQTIECEVIKIQNAVQGVYTVKYTENSFTVHSINNASYTIGDLVYVLVPQGDFSKNKIILGKVEKETKTEVTQNKNKYNEISPNLITELDEISLCTYHNEEKQFIIDKDFMQTLLNPYDKFVFQVDVRTDIKDILQRNNGNYGIKIKIPINTEEETEEYIEQVIDTKNMIGNVYNYEIYTTQKLYFNFNGETYDKNRNIIITAFVNNFMQNEDIDIPDIYFNNIELKAVEELSDELISGTYLNIKSSEGFYFIPGKYTEDKILTPELILDGEPLDIRSYECYWFKEDSSVGLESEYYTNIGGPGWKVLNNRRRVGDNNGIPIYDYETLKNYTCKVKQTDLLYKNRYRCVLLNAEEKYEKIITIINLSNDIVLSLDTDTGFHNYIKNIGNVTLKAKVKFPNIPDNSLIQYNFLRKDKDGLVITEDKFYKIIDQKRIEDTDEMLITFPVSKIDQINIIECSFYLLNPNGINEFLGTEFVTLTTSQKDVNFLTQIENANIIYKYDANGNAPDLATFDGPLESRIIKFEPLKLKVIKTYDNLELSSEEYNSLEVTWVVPKDSMFKIDEKPTKSDDENDYYIGKNLTTLEYEIEPQFDNTKRDKFISVFYTLNDKTSYPENVNIHFIKDGESGTNGSQYSAYITYNDYGYGEIVNKIPQKFRGLFIDNFWRKYDNDDKTVKDWEYGGLPQFSVKVYKSGKLLEDNEYTVKWQMLDFKENDNTKTFRIDEDNGSLIIAKNWNSINTKPINIIQATIIISTSKMNDAESAKQVLLAYYPIDVIYFGNELNGNPPFIPSIENGFNEVLYDNDFTNPQYNTNKPFKIEVLNDQVGFQVAGWDFSDNTLEDKGSISEYEKELEPVSTYDIDLVNHQNNYIGVKIIPDKDMTENIRSGFNKEIDEINYQLQLLDKKDDFFESLSTLFNYNALVKELEKCDVIISYRSKYLLYLQDLFDLANGIKELDSTYENYPLMVADVIANVINAKSIEEIDYYAGGAIEIPYDSTSTQLNNLIYNFNDKIEECKQLYLIIANNASLEDGISDLTSFQQTLTALPNEIENLEIDSKYEDLIYLKNCLIDNITGYINSQKTFLNKNNLLDVLNKIKNIFETYNLDNRIDNTREKEQLLKQKYNLEAELGEAIDINRYDYQLNKTIIFYIIKPIIFDVNRYGLASLNGWDGNKIYTGNNDEYLFAPQVGAGIKNESNQFTGIVMGKRFLNSSSEIDVGLFGYKDGMQSIFLDSKTGDLILGFEGEEQIQLRPGPGQVSTIADWAFTKYGFEKNQDGCTVGLYCDPTYEDGIAFKAYGPSATSEDTNEEKKVEIYYDGTLKAYGAELVEADVTGVMRANEGFIGGEDGWAIGSGYLQSRNGSILLSAEYEKIGIGKQIWLYGDESLIGIGLYPNDTHKIEIDGEEGEIRVGNDISLHGPEDIIEVGNIILYGSTNKIEVGNDELQLIGGDKHIIQAGEVIISGHESKIQAGSVIILGEDSQIQANNILIDGDNSFIQAGDITIDGDTSEIYNLTIDPTDITKQSKEGFYFTSDQAFIGEKTRDPSDSKKYIGNYLEYTSNGELIIKGNLTADAGKIGPWSIDSEGISSGRNIHITPEEFKYNDCTISKEGELSIKKGIFGGRTQVLSNKYNQGAIGFKTVDEDMVWIVGHPSMKNTLQIACDKDGGGDTSKIYADGAMFGNVTIGRYDTNNYNIITGVTAIYSTQYVDSGSKYATQNWVDSQISDVKDWVRRNFQSS